MSDLKKILVVDDRYEILEFLRSSLDPSSQEYELEAVPSAEEAMLEMRQDEFHLLITEVRLPGMSGFDLVRRMRRLKPELPAIMVADYSSEQGQQEAAELGVRHYFQKPLETDVVLTAVNSALYGSLVVYPDDPEVPVPADIDVPEAAQERLETLRTDTAASQIVLATASGRVLSQVGGGQGIDLPKLTALIAENLANSTRIAQQLGGMSLNTIQHHTGNEVELYIASGGPDYFLAIFFDAQARRGRMGTIWVFAQRAIKDLLSMLPVMSAEVPQTPGPPTPDADAEPARPPETPGETELQPDAKMTTPPFRVPEVTAAPAAPESEPLAPTEEEGFFTLGESAAQDSSEVDAFWESATSEGTTGALVEGALSFEQAQRHGLIPVDSEPEQDTTASEQPDLVPESEPADLSALFALEDQVSEGSQLDDFWGEALEEYDEGAPLGSGLSFEEAIKEGLIPDQMKSGDDSVSGTELNQEAEEDQ